MMGAAIGAFAGGGMTLPILWMALGQKYTAQELQFWYHHAPMLAKTRKHPWGSPDKQAASWARWETYNKWGHRRGGKE